jgi:hypothetical protein
MCLNFIGPSIEAQGHVGALYFFGLWVLGDDALHSSDRGKVWSIHRPVQYHLSQKQFAKPALAKQSIYLTSLSNATWYNPEQKYTKSCPRVK